MAQSYYKTPQILTRHWLWSLEKRNWDMEAIYFNWQKKQAPAIFLSLTGQAKEALVGDDINKLSCDKGVETLIKEFDKIGNILHIKFMDNLRNFVDWNQWV